MYYLITNRACKPKELHRPNNANKVAYMFDTSSTVLRILTTIKVTNLSFRNVIF